MMGADGNGPIFIKTCKKAFKNKSTCFIVIFWRSRFVFSSVCGVCLWLCGHFASLFVFVWGLFSVVLHLFAVILYL